MELCVYHKHDRLYELVTASLKKNIEFLLLQLRQKLCVENCDVLQVVSQFWTSTYRYIKTVASLLIHLSRSNPTYCILFHFYDSYDISSFAFNFIRTTLISQENEMNTISIVL